jgi:hypothetical protein
MKKLIVMQLLVCFVAGISFGAQFDPGANVLGEKRDFLHADKLKEVSSKYLAKERGAGRCIGGDIHSVPRLEDDEEFIVGFPTLDGGENLVHVWNRNGSAKHLHCIFEDKLKAHYYFISSKYVERKMETRDGTYWAEVFYSRRKVPMPEKLTMSIWGQSYYYYLANRTIENLLKEINMDMLTHVFISPLVKKDGFKVFTDIEGTILQLFIQRGGKRYSLGACDNLKSSKQILDKVAKFAAEKFNVTNLFNFPENFAVPEIEANNEQAHLSKNTFESMVINYLRALEEINSELADVDISEISDYKLQ